MTPKEALEAIKHIYYYDENINNGEHINIDLDEICKEELDIIDQALTEHENQKQILEVLKIKVVAKERAKNCEDVNAYNNYVLPPFSQLTETEFNLIKEWINEN